MSVARTRSRRQRELLTSSAIGWISTSDALLFGIGILVLFSAGITRSLHDSQAENARLVDDKRLLVERADKAAEDKVRLTDQLTKSEIRRTSSESMLERSREEVRVLESALTVLKGEHSRLVDQHAAMIRQSENLRSSLDSLNSEMRSQQETITALSTLVEKLRTAGRERIGTLNSQLAQKSEEVKALKKKFDVERASYESAIRNNDATKIELNSALAALSKEKHFRRELIGVKGQFSKVAILLDRSGSMQEGGRWEDAKSVMRTWIDYLQMDSCVVVVFSTDVETFPPEGGLVDLTGTEGSENRRRLAAYLEGVQPEGGTNTLKALEVAYGYSDIDTIVLFTDGAPNDGKSATFDPAVAARIRTLIDNKANIPINAVGLGDYFRPELSEFLLELAKSTKGTFLGR